MSTSEGLKTLFEDEYKKLSNHEFHFENLVFNGGGTMCIAEIGTLKVFDELQKRGNLQKIKRYAGNSGGSLVAGFAALGFSGDELDTLLRSVDLKKKVEGCQCGILTPAWNLLRHMGFETADGLEKWFEDNMYKKTGIHHITFGQLYDGKGVELALTASDVARKNCVFFHVKTHRDMPIVKAMRMSMSIPVIFTPQKMPELPHEPRDTVGLFVDGGLLCNYPIMCYDGWYLSMAEDSGFLHRYPVDRKNLDHMRDRRFRGYNKKTVGVMVYNATEQDIIDVELTARSPPKPIVKRPNPPTKLSTARGADVDKMDKCVKARVNMQRAMDRLIEKSKTDLFGKESRDTTITLKELKEANIQPPKKTLAILLLLTLNDCDSEQYPVFTQENINEVFPGYGGNTANIKRDVQSIFSHYENPEDIFKTLKIPDTGSISFIRIQRVAEKLAMGFLEEIRNSLSPAEEIKHISKYLFSVISTPTFHIDRGQFTEKDMRRTIGINTDYIRALDFGMETPDRDYLIHRGMAATLGYLEWYMEHGKDE